MELYVHIPFCKSKCRYCDFASYSGRESWMEDYISALLTETRIRSEELGHPVMETVFIGGGTPSLLPATLLDQLLTGLHTFFTIAPNAEFTSEANPGTLDRAWLDIAVKQGVNRISMGMQAYQTELLRTLGRIHDFTQVQHSVQLCRDAGIRNLNLDLMFGLPGQKPEQWLETLQAALSLEPQHLSCYGLIPEEGTPLMADLEAGRLVLPDEDDERRMYDDTLTYLARYGFEQYEISNFALPGHACRHNLGYWQQIPYLGLGASASSMLPSSDACYRRETNPASLEAYLTMVRQQHFSAREVLPIFPADARFETMMLGLRTTQGVSEAHFQAMHGMTLDSCYGEKLRSLHQRGLMTFSDGWWRLTRRGMDVQNAILVELMDE